MFYKYSLNLLNLYHVEVTEIEFYYTSILRKSSLISYHSQFLRPPSAAGIHQNAFLMALILPFLVISYEWNHLKGTLVSGIMFLRPSTLLSK